MKSERIGNDIKIEWSILREGTPFSLSNKDVSIYLGSQFGRTKISGFTIDSNKVIWTFFGKDQKSLGKYSLVLVINEGNEGMITTDICDFVNLVSCTCEVGGADNEDVQTETIALTSNLEYVASEYYDDTAIWEYIEKMEKAKADKSEIPTRVSQLDNDAEFATAEDLNGKQDKINDLDTIRKGAAKGATALQSIPAEYVTDAELDNALRPKVNRHEVATINGQSILNGGNIVIEGGSGGGSYDDTGIKKDISDLKANDALQDAELAKLSEEIGVYQGKKYANTIIFTKDEIPSGNTIIVSFTTLSSNGNVIVRDAQQVILERFQIANATIGQVFPQESYVLPSDYQSVEVGGYGDIELNLIVENANPKKQAEKISDIESEIASQAEKIDGIKSELVIENVGDVTPLEPTSIDEGKFLYVASSSAGKESSSTSQNIANFDVSEINNVELTIVARVSTNNLIGYQFILNDGTTEMASPYESGGSVAEHKLIVPKGATTLRFSYYIDGGISATYSGSVSLKEYVLQGGGTQTKSSDIALSLAGADAIKVSADTLTNAILTIEGVPTYTKKDCVLSFKADVASFNGISFGLGYETTRGMQIFIDSTNVTYKRANQEAFKEAHGLTIGTFLRCSVYHELTKYVFVISTISGTYYKEFTEQTFYASETYGVPYLYADGSTTLNNVVISRGGSDFKKPVWIFGDSYLSFQEERWIYYILTYGFKNYMLCGLAGASSAQMFEQFQNCLKFGTPKYVVWCLGMNDGTAATPYKTYYEKVRSICEGKGIELILQTIPNIPNADKSAINNIIKESGLRIIDAADAVGSYENANWYDGFLGDGVHPSALGAKAIASQVLADFPEIMQYS